MGAALDPTERLIMELPKQGDPPYGDRITGRAIDLIAPLGRGQRCLLVAPPKAGKTRILQAIAASVAHNHPEVKVYALLVDERPEEVTDFKRNTPAEVIAASSDMSVDEHIETSEIAMQKVATDVLAGKDVVLLLDSITRLARAYNAAAGNGGRTMSGGSRLNAMQSPRQILARRRDRERRLADDHRHRAGRHRLAHGPDHLRGVQGHRKLRDLLSASWPSAASTPRSTSPRAARARRRS
jgi:transcription termination factor Rho